MHLIIISVASNTISLFKIIFCSVIRTAGCYIYFYFFMLDHFFSDLFYLLHIIIFDSKVVDIIILLFLSYFVHLVFFGNLLYCIVPEIPTRGPPSLCHANCDNLSSPVFYLRLWHRCSSKSKPYLWNVKNLANYFMNFVV